MPSIRTIALALAFFFPFSTTHHTTPAEVEVGRIEGSTGDTFSRTGDYLTSTFCFCTVRTPIPQQYSEAHYFQFDYYNAHRNTTFILDHLCLADSDSATTCHGSRYADGINLRYSFDWAGPLCRTWYNAEESRYHHVSDYLCYEPSRNDGDRWRQWLVPGPDKLRFNGQKRKLDSVGGQGPVLKRKEEAEGKCERLCGEHAHMDVLRDSELVQCHEVVYEDLDDMCEGCK